MHTPAIDQPLSDQRPEGLNLEEEKGTEMFTRTRSMERPARTGKAVQPPVTWSPMMYELVVLFTFSIRVSIQPYGPSH